MGVDVLNALECNSTSAAGEASSSVEPSQRHPFLPKYSNFSSTDTGRCIASFNDKPLIDPILNPAAEPLRREPLTYNDKSCKKLDVMDRDRSVEKIDSSSRAQRCHRTEARLGYSPLVEFAHYQQSDASRLLPTLHYRGGEQPPLG